MKKIYIIYTINNIPNIGGATPQGVEIGISSYKHLRCGSVAEELDLLKISEFNPIVVSESEAFGLNYIDKEGLIETSDEEIETIAPFTDEQQLQKEAAEKLLIKLQKRFSVDAYAGDAQDLLADVSKKLSILYKLIVPIMDKVVNNNSIGTSETQVLKQFINDYNADELDISINNQIDKIDIIELSKKLRIRDSKLNDAIG